MVCGCDMVGNTVFGFQIKSFYGCSRSSRLSESRKDLISKLLYVQGCQGQGVNSAVYERQCCWVDFRESARVETKHVNRQRMGVVIITALKFNSNAHPLQLDTSA
jgi:hypothetical protein